MTPEIQNLLNLLDHKSQQPLREYCDQEGLWLETGESWADLAFRLRDAAVAENDSHWLMGMIAVDEWINNPTQRERHFWDHVILEYKCQGSDGFSVWMAAYGQPRHFIVASLIARKLKEQQ